MIIKTIVIVIMRIIIAIVIAIFLKVDTYKLARKIMILKLVPLGRSELLDEIYFIIIINLL